MRVDASPARAGGGYYPTYDVFIDLTGVDVNRTSTHEYLDRLAREAGLAGVVGQITLALPIGSEPPVAPLSLQVDADPAQPATVLLERAIVRAATLRRHLVVLLGPVLPGNEVLSVLIEALDRDPLFGTAQPRFAQDETDEIWTLPGPLEHKSTGSTISRTVLPFLPVGTITPELLAACVVLRPNALVAVSTLDHGYGGAAGAFLHLLCEMRRRGLRNVVVNRAVVTSHLTYRDLYPVLADADVGRLRAAYPDNALAEAETARLTQRALEPLLAAAHRRGGERRILLDCRGLGPQHNGSTQCVLGFLDGFAALDSAAQIDLLVWSDAARFHGLAQRYPAFGQVPGYPTDQYFAAIGLTPPWALTTVADLHRHALLVAFLMLDTIAWDVLYPSGAGALGTVWGFTARYSDALLYISHFTRERFRTRFPLDPRVAEQVTHLSLLQDEHVDAKALTEPVNDHILLFGNEYNHKDVRPTLQLLVDAFPFNRIVVVGIEEAVTPNVTAIASGQIGHADLHRLIASARVMVFPSFYEGFGLPVVEGLAYGRPVVVRRSPLWAEIAGWSRLPGELVEFSDAPTLVETVGRVLAGLPVHPLPSGVELGNGAAPAAWKDCASRMIGLLNQCVAAADGERWREREEALRLAGL